MKTYKIHLIRHGINEGSEEGQYLGHTDVPLSAYGKKQLEEMKREYIYPKVSAVMSSPLDRCLETARILYPDQKPVIFDGLIEYDFGEFEGLTADDLKNEECFSEWLKGDGTAEAPNGESNQKFQKRIYNTFVNIVNGIIKAGLDEIAVITHGGVIMAIMTMFALPEAPMTQWLTPNGCGYTLNIIPSIWGNIQKVEAFDEVPLRPADENDDDDENQNWDIPIDPEEFKGFYTPELQ